jgi:hypothetical protein
MPRQAKLDIPGVLHNHEEPGGIEVLETLKREGNQGRFCQNSAIVEGFSSGPCKTGLIKSLRSRIVKFGAPIAQLDRAPDYESVGRVFESPWARQEYQ